MVLLGYKSDWRTDPAGAEDAFSLVNRAIDLHLAVAILRVRGGLDYSGVIAREEQVTLRQKRKEEEEEQQQQQEMNGGASGERR